MREQKGVQTDNRQTNGRVADLQRKEAAQGVGSGSQNPAGCPSKRTR